MFALVLLLAALVGITLLLTRAWAERALDRLTYARVLPVDRCFVGEEVELRLEVTNDKALPVGFLRADEQVPVGLSIAGRAMDYLRQDRSLWRQIWSINWYQRVTRRYRLQAHRRGLYQIGPVTLGAGDPFGLRLQYREETEQAPLVVYPRLRPLTYAGLPPGHPFGSQRSHDPLLADPMQIAGIREYASGDPLNRIHWKATAATGTLQVRTLEPTAQQVVAVFINAWSFDKGWQGTDVEAIELAVDTAAAMIKQSLDAGRQVALYSNGPAEGWGGLVRVPAGRSAETMGTCLEALARLSPQGMDSLAEVVAHEGDRLPYGAVLVVITRQLGPELAGVLHDLQARGRRVRLIFTTPEHEPVPPGLHAWLTRDGDTLMGEDADAICVEPIR